MEFTSDNLSNHVDNRKVAREMQNVLLALVPGIVAMVWFFGLGVLSNIILASIFGLGFEALLLKIRGRSVKVFLGDYSALLTSVLLAISLPAFAQWWLLAVALFFAIVIAKHLYGGLGYNPFNPAMVGFAVVMVSFPAEMVGWLSPTASHFSQPVFLDGLDHVFGGISSQWDSMTMATPLNAMQTGLGMDKKMADIGQLPSFGLVAGKGWEWVSLGFLLGGLWLVMKKIITWHIPMTLLAVLAGLSGLFWLIDAEHYANPTFHLLAGGTMLGAFFIATDPVTASTTPLGKIIYGATIAFFLYTIRVWGSGYPDGVAFSVLIMNMAVPLIDYYTQPKVFGESRQ
ncbi:MAG: RnfABCDGE type electron transport complex subunit D [Thiotrichaceae bacterium]|nr:RnfABCDGE type electron transport complex subunit D [Thiotrichaceae bacterium]